MTRPSPHEIRVLYHKLSAVNPQKENNIKDWWAQNFLQTRTTFFANTVRLQRKKDASQKLFLVKKKRICRKKQAL
jgi:hypothetical protein